MGFYHRIALALLLIYLFDDNVLGAPTRGRYTWVICNPDGKNANCVKKMGPQIDLKGQGQKLPPSATKDIFPVESGEDTPGTESEEQSGEGSGDLDPPAYLPHVIKNRMADGPAEVGPQVEEPFLEEETSGDVDYSNFVFPEPVEAKLSAEDLREDNMIQ